MTAVTIFRSEYAQVDVGVVTEVDVVVVVVILEMNHRMIKENKKIKTALLGLEGDRPPCFCSCWRGRCPCYWRWCHCCGSFSQCSLSPERMPSVKKKTKDWHTQN